MLKIKRLADDLVRLWMGQQQSNRDVKNLVLESW